MDVERCQEQPASGRLSKRHVTSEIAGGDQLTTLKQFCYIIAFSLQPPFCQHRLLILAVYDFQTLILDGGLPGVEETQMLNVHDGSGDGEYPAGTIVTVTAGPPTGEQFAGWTGDTSILANPFLATTSATIPTVDVSLTATYTATGAGTVTAEARKVTGIFLFRLVKKLSTSW
jgi:Divergent InlB B-repeat domain